MNALMAALGRGVSFAEGDAAPPLSHWVHFWDVRPPAGLGADGHPARGDFLPPIALPRRMWAGGRLRFERPLLVGATVTRRSTIRSVTEKSGHSGAMIFVTVEHILSDARGELIVEEQDIVYRDAPIPGAVAVPTRRHSAEPADWREEIDAGPVLLFRYSALTMNGHRIHYDRDYAVGQEGYAGLVVQGPLQATLLATLAGRQGGALASFAFRGVSPALDLEPIIACGRADGGETKLWIEQGGVQTMTATARFAA
ncbi:MAG TPA: MaoC family dehydratase N-terminal domain-containing protein [Sphingomonas sp.]|nr:MaoC family dehydratase N-terminal domain-containing protein [Sphingomonas sp.]